MIKVINAPTTVTPEDSKLYLEIDNGDLQALNTIQDRWKFKDKSNLLRFAIAALYKADSKKIFIEKDGKKILQSPGSDLIDNADTSDGQSQET